MKAKPTKYETTIKVRPQKPMVSINQVLDNLFYSTHPIMMPDERPAMNAYKLLEHIKRNNGRFESREWKSYTASNKLSLQQYYAVIHKLRGAGMIQKKDGIWGLSMQFALRCKEYSELWDNYISY